MQYLQGVWQVKTQCCHTEEEEGVKQAPATSYNTALLANCQMPENASYGS